MVIAPTIDDLRAVVGSVCDPELPPLNLDDLGIVRSVDRVDGTVVVTVTPTYSGCPAVDYIEDQIRTELEAVGCDRVEIVRAFSPAWTTDWITDEGRAKMTRAGIAPPGAARPTTGAVPVGIGRRESVAVACPRCQSLDTELISPFGSTACKALHRCRACAEPFDHFKAI